jgi:hypothetical protein
MFECFPCYATPFTGLVAYSPVTLLNNLYYNNGDGFVYYTNFSIGYSATYDVNLSGAAGQSDCASACSI